MDNKILLLVFDAILFTLFSVSLFLQMKSYYKYENGLKDIRKAFVIALISCLFMVIFLFLRDLGVLFFQERTSAFIHDVTPTVLRVLFLVIAVVGVMIRMGSKFQFLEAEYWKQKFLKLKEKRKE